MNSAYFDTAYIVKVYCPENGSEQILEYTEQISTITSSLHAYGEFVSTLHRKRREQVYEQDEIRAILAQFHYDISKGLIKLLPIHKEHYGYLEKIYDALPHSANLRAADALHLATASLEGFREIYSNDRNLLSSASYFGLQGLQLF